MKNKVFFPLLAALLMMGACVVTSCSNDDDQSAGSEQTANTATLPQQFNDAVTTVNEEMSALDFEALAPLAAAAAENAGNDSTGVNPKFSAWLQQLLQLLDQNLKKKLPGGITLGFRPLQDVLSTVWSVSSERSSGKDNGYGWVKRSDAIAITANYTARDSSVYQVTLEQKIEHNLLGLTEGGSKERTLTIKKNDQQLLAIKSCKEAEIMMVGIMPSLSLEFTGELAYKAYAVSLGLGRASAHDRTIQLVVSKDGTRVVNSTTNVTDNLTLMNLLKRDVAFAANYNLALMGDLIAVDGKVNNIKKFVSHAATLLKLRKSGGSQEDCTAFSSMFNENMTISMKIIGSDVGTISMSPVFSDKFGKYVPTLLVVSPLFGDEPIDINTMLSNFGFSIEDIMAMMKGEKTNGDDAVVID